MWLQSWYYSHCNGDWEHGSGIHIVTIDNPGWSVTINLEDTELENRSFQTLKKEISEESWLICFIQNNKFEGRCGPVNLQEILQIFRDWAESNQKES